MILLIDNYDSFVHNLARYVRRLGFATQVIRNDRLSLPEIREFTRCVEHRAVRGSPDPAPSTTTRRPSVEPGAESDDPRSARLQAIVISPGPCTPNEAGISLALIREVAGEIPILGVCLGHQAIVQAFGGDIVRAEEPVHGRTSLIHHDGSPLFAGMANPFHACRYHSLIARRESLPVCLEITAWTDDGTIMAVRHRSLPVVGIQFHPESVLTLDGMTLLENAFDSLGLHRIQATAN